MSYSIVNTLILNDNAIKPRGINASLLAQSIPDLSTSTMMFALLLAGIALIQSVLASALPPLGHERKLLHEYLGKRGYNGSSSCLDEAAPTTSAPKTNIWAQIKPEDNLAVWNLLHAPESALNLTDPSKAKPSDNYV